MIRETKDWTEIEIDTYDDINHLRNIWKKLWVIWWNMLDIYQLKRSINDEILQDAHSTPDAIDYYD